MAERKPNEAVPDDGREFANSTWTQTRHLIVRTGRHFYRDASYVSYLHKLDESLLTLMHRHTESLQLVSSSESSILCEFYQIKTGGLADLWTSSTFYQLSYGSNALQQAAFSTFLIIMLLPALANASIPAHFMLKAYWQIRESKSRTYNWIALMTAILVNELPYAIILSVIYFVLAYFPTGFRESTKLFVDSITKSISQLLDSPLAFISLVFCFSTVGSILSLFTC